MAECRCTRDGNTGIAIIGASPCEVSEMYLPNDSSETSHSSDLVNRKVISSIEGKMSGVSVMPSARTRPCVISRTCSEPQTASVRCTDAVPLLLTICGARASDAGGLVFVDVIYSDSRYAEFLSRLRGFYMPIPVTWALGDCRG